MNDTNSRKDFKLHWLYFCVFCHQSCSFLTFCFSSIVVHQYIWRHKPPPQHTHLSVADSRGCVCGTFWYKLSHPSDRFVLLILALCVCYSNTYSTFHECVSMERDCENVHCTALSNNIKSPLTTPSSATVQNHHKHIWFPVWSDSSSEEVFQRVHNPVPALSHMSHKHVFCRNLICNKRDWGVSAKSFFSFWNKRTLRSYKTLCAVQWLLINTGLIFLRSTVRQVMLNEQKMSLRRVVFMHQL